MKPLLILFYLLLSICVITACSGDDEATDEKRYTITVTGGDGSGDYPAGTRITIVAHAAPSSQVFDQWTGDTEVLGNATSATTIVIMPERNVQVTATYKAMDLGTPVTVTVDPNTTYQTIDGFGFFGAYDVWWGSNSNMWSNAWGEKVISDLGITIWRNEYFPPSTETAPQDADWSKQKPVVEGLKAAADKYGVNLKFIFTVWSPPAEMKWQATIDWAGDQNATRQAGPVSTKNGGTMNPNMYGEYANWLKAGINLYKESGIDVYAISLQNEPMFKQSFNSCQYTTTWYNELLINVVPAIRATYPAVNIFGSEHMLDMEGADENWPYFYHSGIKSNASAAAGVDILAVHGYNDGVAPTSGSGLAERWTNHREQFSGPMNKRSWMTETSGYLDSWTSPTKPGALSLAQDIHAGLFYGNMSAWVWWQGSQLDGIGEYNLMNGITVGKKYYVSKHFYRYIRPGAVRIGATSNDQNNIFVTAYKHVEKETMTIVAINSGTTDKLIYIEGESIPAGFIMYRTTAGSDNCTMIGPVQPGSDNNFVIPAQSIITLQAGGDEL
jgi:glucuronoarabinoxylan endo-1,4-beta-xylanase